MLPQADHTAMRLSGSSIGGSRWCPACRATILRSFTSRSRPQQQQQHQQRRRRPQRLSSINADHLLSWDLRRRPTIIQVRWLTSTDDNLESPGAREDVEVKSVDDHFAESGMSGDDNKKQDNGSFTIQSQPLPWYLQLSDERQEISRPLSDRQRLPDLPEHPPPLLQPLLQHVSVDLGLDNLTLLDLRELDPPPALGSNTLMVIGTACGEKHLYVSADRLCRWLRGNHKLRPYADGLLGRNELKLKMRRRTRKAKLLGNLVGLPGDDADDELRTGWVCVNIGRVEPHQSQEPKSEGLEGIVGFGTPSEGVRIVVQIFTEEKRSEMDLEGLWGGLLKESTRKKAQEQGSQGQAEHDRRPMSKKHGPMGMHLYPNHSSMPRKHALNNHIRRVHTSARLFNTGAVRDLQANAESDTIAAMSLPQSTAFEDKPDAPKKVLRHPGDVDKHGWSRSQTRKDSESNLSAERRSVMLLRSLVNDLQNMPPVEARRALGQGAGDMTSTPFLFSFYQTFPTFPTAEHWHCRVQLYCHAIKLAHTGYSRNGLKDILYSMQLSGIDIPQKTLYLMLEAILSRKAAWNKHKWLGGPSVSVIMKLAMVVLEDMGNRNINVLSEEIFILLYEAVSFPVPVWTSEVSNSTNPGPNLLNPQKVSHVRLQNAKATQARLKILMDHYMISFTRDEHIIRLLTLYANQADWTAFFEAWALPARQMLPRSSTLYAFMFDIVAQTNHQMFCMQTLRTYIPELQSENPRVRLTGDVAKSVMRCLKCAHPAVEEEAQQVPLLKGEWVTLWRRCEAGLHHG